MIGSGSHNTSAFRENPTRHFLGKHLLTRHDVEFMFVRGENHVGSVDTMWTFRAM